VIFTKTIIPQRRPNMLLRPRLVERMQQHVDKAMTLVSAPAGYGKTSLLVDFCHHALFPVCWLSLDESDRDFRVFVNSLVAAIQCRFPDFGEHTRRALDVNSDTGNDPTTLANVIVQDLADNAPEFFVLVIDDYHTIDMLPRQGKLLDLILMHAESRWHVVISGRTVPGNLHLIYLIAHEQAGAISQNDLTFTVGEVQQVLEQTHNLTLTPEQAKELVAASEGWVTGIVLATASMWRGIHDILVRARAQEGPIYAYLADQVFEGRPPPLRDTMWALSTLPEMNETLCLQALGLSGAENVLQEMERHGLFLTTVVDETGVRHYRYHHLFRDFLQARLREQDPARFCQLHRQAADWFEAQEEWERAVAHRKVAGDARAMAQTMDRAAKTTHLSGQLETLVAWYGNVPDPLRPEFPRLLLRTARAMLDLGQIDESISLLHQAEANFDEQGERDLVLAAMLQRAVARCAQGGYAETLDIAREILATQPGPDFSTLAAEAHRLSGLACLNLGRSEEAVESLQLALDLYHKLGIGEVAVTYLDLSFALLRLGRLAEGWACQDKAVALYRAIPPSAGFAMTLNDIAYERYYLAGDYGQALSLWREALDVARMAGSPRAQAFALLSTADLYRDLGAHKHAQELYTQAKEFARRLNYADLVNFALLGMAQTHAQVGDAIKALGLATQARDQAERSGDVYQFGLSCLALGTIHLQVGDSQQALAEIERGRERLEKSGARRDLTRAYMLLARAHQVAGDVEGALETLRQALNIGIETQTVHYLVIEGQHVLGLLKQLQRQSSTDRRLAQVMDRIRALPGIAQELLGELAPTALSQQSALRLCGFGPGHAEQDGSPVVWHSAKARYLIFYLLLHPPRSRSQIARAFWPDAKRDAARSAFHWTKSQARRALSRSLVVYKDGLYQIVQPIDFWFDVFAFETLLDGQGENRLARLEEAVSLYRGDFLEDYDAEWCLPIRERLRMRYRDALLELSECYMEEKEFANAALILNRALAIDDLHEPTIRMLMRLYALDGRSGAALDLSHQLERQLQELRVPLERETQSLRRSIQAELSHLPENPT